MKMLPGRSRGAATDMQSGGKRKIKWQEYKFGLKARCCGPDITKQLMRNDEEWGVEGRGVCTDWLREGGRWGGITCVLWWSWSKSQLKPDELRSGLSKTKRRGELVFRTRKEEWNEDMDDKKYWKQSTGAWLVWRRIMYGSLLPIRLNGPAVEC